MSDKYPPDKQREPILGLVQALNCRDSALRRDECGDWRITGKHGFIYAVPGSLDRKEPGFHLIVMGWSANGWNRAKKALEPFAELANDGGDEGSLFIFRLPTQVEAGLIRHWLGLAKKAEFSAEVLAQKRESVLKARQKIGPATRSRLAGSMTPAGA